MPIFRMIRDALSPSAVALAAPVIAGVADRTDGKFNFASSTVSPEERAVLLSVLKEFLGGPVPEVFRTLHGDPLYLQILTHNLTYK